jgi:hypothetical protein
MHKGHFRNTLFNLAMVIVTVVSLTILGCGGDDVPDLQTRSIDITVANAPMLVGAGLDWVFPNGQIIDDNLADAETTVTFANSTTADLQATVTSAGGMADADVTIASCTFDYMTSNYGADAGPQIGDMVTFNPCRLIVLSSACNPENFDEETSCSANLDLTRDTLTNLSQPVTVNVLVRESDGAIFVNDVNTGLILLDDGTITGSTGGS